MCGESNSRTIGSPLATAAIYTAWGLPVLGFLTHGIWGAVGAAAAVGIIATSAPKWTKSNLLEKIEQRWLERWTARTAKRDARKEQERLERIKSCQKQVEHPSILSRGAGLVSPWMFAISFWLLPAATPLNLLCRETLISISWMGMILAILGFASVNYAADQLKAELQQHQPEIKIETFREIAHVLQTWRQRYPVFIGCSEGY